MKRAGKFADVPLRVKSWGYIIVVFIIMLLHPLSMSALVTCLSLYALREYFTITSVKSRFVQIPAYTMALLAFIPMYINNYAVFVWLVALGMLILLIIHTLFPRENITGIWTGVFLCVFCFAHLAFIRQINDSQIVNIKIVLFLVLLTEMNDVFQYLTGKVFGKTKITPSISPNKTVEGFTGGVILTALLANLTGVFLLPGNGLAAYTLTGICIAFLGFCGDIFLSSIKRKAHVKDTGNLLPGHGGLLDRIDSLLFVLPVAFFVFRWGLA